MSLQPSNDNNPWPGSQLSEGRMFYWASKGEDGTAIYRGEFAGYGKEVKTAGGSDHPVAKFLDAQVSTDYGASWQAVESGVFSSHNTFYTNQQALIRAVATAD